MSYSPSFQMKSRVLWPPVRTSAIKVALSASYCRQIVSSYYETLIDTAWRDLCETEGPQFSTPLFRLHDCSLPGSCSDFQCRAGLTCSCSEESVLVEACNEVELRLGLSNTRESSVTRQLSVLSSDLAYIGYELHKKPQMFLANSIDVHAAFVTKDGYVPLVRSLTTNRNGSIEKQASLDRTRSTSSLNSKSGSVSSKTSLRAPAILPKWSLPTGGPEPSTCNILTYKDLVSRNTQGVQKEVVESVFRSLHDMLGIKTPSSEPAALLALHFDKKHNNKPELLFILKSGLTSIELADIFRKSKAKNLYELAFIRSQDLKTPLNENEKMPFCQVVERKISQAHVEAQSVGDIFKSFIKLTQKHSSVDLTKAKF